MKLLRKHWIIILTAPLAVLLDQASKLAIHSYFRLYDSAAIIPGYLNIYYARNTGLVFGMFSDRLGAYSTWIFLGITIVALSIIVNLFFRAENKAVLLPLALSLVLSGALGNLIDRLHWGYVVDFIQAFYISQHPPYRAHYWPTFNVADMAITAGIILLLIDSFRPQPQTKVDQPAKAPGPEGGPGAH